MQTAGIFDIPHLRPLGRINEEAAHRTGVLPLFWACSGLEVCFDGAELRIVLEADFGQLEPWIAVEVDGAALIRMPVNRGCSEVCVFRGAEAGRPRTVRLLKETQPLAEDPRHNLPGQYERICGVAAGTDAQALGSQMGSDFAAWKPDAVIVNLGTNDANALSSPAWTGPGGEQFRQLDTPEGLGRIEDAAVAFLRQLRRCNPDAALVWAYGMCGDRLRPQLEGAVERFRRESGCQRTYYLPLPAASEETMGSRQHPGPRCHAAAAEAAAGLLKSIL